MKNPSTMSENDRVRDQVRKEPSARLKETLRQQHALTRPGTSSKSETVPGAWKKVEEFWDNVPL